MLGAVLMLKNEESSVKLTLDSVRDHVKHVIVFDTGSTDNTIDIIKRTCKKNKQVLHIKEGGFVNFAVSRNESLDFAEAIAKKHSIEFLVLLDAGDEFRTKATKNQMVNMLSRVSRTHIFGIVMKQWLSENGTIDHYDVRIIRVGCGCRYNTAYPVHETFTGRTAANMILMKDLIVLYQDRIQYGGSSNARLRKDIQMLLEAPAATRNYFHLGQTYADIHDYDNSVKYYLLAYEHNRIERDEIDGFDDKAVLSRVLMGMVLANKDSALVTEYFHKLVAIDDRNINAYIYYFKYCIESNNHSKAQPYVATLAALQDSDAKNQIVSHNFYDYLRWHLISIVCLKTGDDDAIGKAAATKAYAVSKSVQDQMLLMMFENRAATS